MTPIQVPYTLLLLWLSLQTYAAPTEMPLSPGGLKIPLRMRSPTSGRSLTELGDLAKSQRDALNAKYYSQSKLKRSTGYNLIVDQQYDSGYYGSLAIGTPLTSFDVILDTGSSDLWVASSSCSVSTCKNIPLFNPSASSTFKDLTTSFIVTYGSGQVSGYVGQDVVEMAGFSISNQGFGVVDTVSSNTITSPVSGLIGLAWAPLASSGQTPFWQTLASSGAMDSALFAVQLRRYGNATNPNILEPGGEITLGYTNSSLYTGSIDYIDIPGTPDYWYLDISAVTVQGTKVSIGSQTMAAIDTGTTLIAGPSSTVAAIYAQIPNSSPGTGQWQGYYQYPCSSSVTVEFSFGGNTWAMSPADFMYTSISSSECIGAIFETSSVAGSTSPAWIIGDAFLKNVYSVFRYNPPSIGFAALSEVALAENGVNGPVPSATIGSVSATITNTSGATPRVRLGLGRGLVSCGIVALVTMTLLML